MKELEVDPEGFFVDCPKTRGKRTARDCWIPGGLECDHLEGVDCKPGKADPTKPRIVVRCKYPEV